MNTITYSTAAAENRWFDGFKNYAGWALIIGNFITMAGVGLASLTGHMLDHSELSAVVYIVLTALFAYLGILFLFQIKQEGRNNPLWFMVLGALSPWILVVMWFLGFSS